MTTALPDRYLITPEPGGGPDFSVFLGQLSAALRSGIRLVQLRSKAMDAATYERLAGEALQLCRAHGARLILNGPGAGTGDTNADGIHLPGTRLMACATRPLGAPKLVSAACHGLEELRQAERIGADFVTLSPVLPTRSHPDTAPMGWTRFAELAAAVCLPVYALGGMTPAHLALARSHGAHGIAAIGGLWG